MAAPLMSEVARDYVTDGIPPSGVHEIRKRDLRAWGAWIEQIVNALIANGGVIYASKAALDADLARAANTMAWVVEDATAANNGVYRKVGASGTGSWARAADLPYSFIVASDVGDGTPNAIQATSPLPIGSSALVLLNIYEVNTSTPVTVSFNGGTPLTIKSNTGNNISTGGLQPGMLVMGRVSGSTFRLVTDQVSAAIIAQAEAYLAEFKALFLGAFTTANEPTTDPQGNPLLSGAIYYNLTEGQLRVWDGSVWQSVDAPQFADAAEAKAATSPAKALPALASVIDSALQRSIARGYGVANARDYGAALDGVTNDAAAINAALAAYPTVYIPPSTAGCRINSKITLAAGQSIAGLRQKSRIIHGGSTDLFEIAGSDVSISGLKVDAANNTAGYTIFLNSIANMERIDLEHIYTENGKGLVRDANSTGLIITLNLRNVRGRYHKGRGILLNDAWAFLEMDHVYIDFLNNPSPTNQVGIELNGNEGAVLHNVEVTGSSGIIAGTTGSQIGFNFNNCKSIKAFNLFADACGGYGLRMASCDFIKMVAATLNICNDSALLLDTCNRVKFEAGYLGGRRGLAGAATSVSVINVLGGGRIGFSGCEIENGTGDGITSSNAGVTVMGGSIFNNTGRGIRTVGTSLLKAVGTDILSNTEGLYALAAATDYIRSCRNNAGALIDVQGVANA